MPKTTRRIVGSLALGAERGLVDFDQAIERLAATNFRLDPNLIELLSSTLSDFPSD
jgi:hypothetical protein